MVCHIRPMDVVPRLAAVSPWHSNVKVTVICLPENENRGYDILRWDFEENGGIRCGL